MSQEYVYKDAAYKDYFSLTTTPNELVPKAKQMPLAHKGSITCLTSMRPGLSVSGSDDQTVSVYNYYTGERLQQWFGHQQSVSRVAYGREVRLVISASRDRKIIAWQEGNPNPKWITTGHSLPITGLDINLDNSMICTGSRDNSIKLWDTASGNLITSNTIQRNLVTHLRWSPKSSFIVETSEDKELRLWDPRTPLQVLFSFNQKQYIQTHCDVSADENYILTCSNGNSGVGCEATLWDVRKRRILREYSGHQQTVTSSVFLSKIKTLTSEFASHIATVSLDQTVRVWDQETTECLFEKRLEGTGPLADIVEFPDARYCHSPSGNSAVHARSNAYGSLDFTSSFSILEYWLCFLSFQLIVCSDLIE